MRELERMEKFIERIPFSGCWLWTGSLSGSGYGQFLFGKKLMGAHRASWILKFGPIPNGGFICHICDVKICVNPAHLFLGDPLGNMRDMINKGRDLNGRIIQGQKLRILTEQQAIEVIASDLSFRVLAKQYGVSRGTIQHIKQRRTYKNLDAQMP